MNLIEELLKENKSFSKDAKKKVTKEDTVKKSNGKWTNRGDDGTEHGEFDTKKKADDQRKAMYANGFKGESVKKLKEEINPSDYTAVTVSFDMAVPRNNIPRSNPDSSFVHAIYDAMDELGYVMLTDDYGFSIEDADYYSEEDLEDLLSDEWI